MTSLKGKLVKTGVKVVSHGCYVAFQMAEVALSQHLFADILRLIAKLFRRPIQRPREVFDCLAFEANPLERCVQMTEKIGMFRHRTARSP